MQEPPVVVCGNRLMVGSLDPIFDDQETASVGAVAVQQSNSSVIWVGTGEGNPRNSLNGGEGIYKSLDAGKSWKRMGLEKTRNIHRVVIDPTIQMWCMLLR